MTITATFSNGFTDTYKGKRDVKAAWAIILTATGETLMSGHSMDRASAAKTAEGNFRYVSRKAGATVGRVDRPDRDARRNIIWNGYARAAGFANWKAYYEAFRADQDMARRNVTVEIIDL